MTLALGGERGSKRKRERDQWEGATDKRKAYDSAYQFGDVASNDPHTCS